jgi:hypothetical protein
MNRIMNYESGIMYFFGEAVIIHYSKFMIQGRKGGLA